MAYSFCCMSWRGVGNSVIVLNGATAGSTVSTIFDNSPSTSPLSSLPFVVPDY